MVQGCCLQIFTTTFCGTWTCFPSTFTTRVTVCTLSLATVTVYCTSHLPSLMTARTILGGGPLGRLIFSSAGAGASTTASERFNSIELMIDLLGQISFLPSLLNHGRSATGFLTPHEVMRPVPGKRGLFVVVLPVWTHRQHDHSTNPSFR